MLLEGLKVLDVASWIAAPVASTLLADLGAKVIKIELPEVGDGYRQFAVLPVTPDSDENYTWQLDARNRRSLALNLRSEEGLKILHQLIEGADVYVTNQPIPLREELGLTYESVAKLNPKIIYASLTAYGEQGPDRDAEGFDLVAYWARSGLMDLVRAEGSPPSPALPGMGDHPTAVTMYANIMTALLRRERTGEGAHVHTSLLANGLWSASCLAQARFNGADFAPFRHPDRGNYPHQGYLTRDERWVTLTMVRTEEAMDRLLVLLEAFDLIADERFASPENRLANARAFADALAGFIVRHDLDWLVRESRAVGVDVVPVAKLDDVVEDPQVIANSMTLQASPEVTKYPVIKPPINVEGLERAPVGPAPELGEHSAQVLAELGYTEDEILALRDRGVI